MSFQFASDYLKHRFTANTRHGTHSPFVYQLLNEVIYDFSSKNEYRAVEMQRKKLLNDDTALTITDLGAGSNVNNNKQKKISDLAKNALKSPRLAQLIYRLVHHHPANTVIELGTCLGITTSYLSVAKPAVQIVSIEGCPETAKVAQRNFEALQLSNIDLQVGHFDDLLPIQLRKMEQLDFIYIDGNHTKSATLQYFNLCLTKVHEGTLIIFDDIYWSTGMKEAWAEIKAHPQVTVTIDLFWIGLVYFRKGQAKEDFKIRF